MHGSAKFKFTSIAAPIISSTVALLNDDVGDPMFDVSFDSDANMCESVSESMSESMDSAMEEQYHSLVKGKMR